MYVQTFHGIPFLPFEGHGLLMGEQQIITFHMKSLSEKVYQHFETFQLGTIHWLIPWCDQTDHIMWLANEWFPTGKFRNVDTPFWIDSSYEKELLDALPLKGHALQKAEMEYHGKFGNTLGRIQHISLMSRIPLCYATCSLATQTVASTLPGFQGIKQCVQYLASHPHKPIFYPSTPYDG